MELHSFIQVKQNSEMVEGRLCQGNSNLITHSLTVALAYS